jgi:hypothetical protein
MPSSRILTREPSNQAALNRAATGIGTKFYCTQQISIGKMDLRVSLTGEMRTAERI